MAKAKLVQEHRVVEKRLASASVPIEAEGPEALLRMGKGGPRGFWAREGRWFAHSGQVASITVPTAEDRSDRFTTVWREARKLLSGTWPDSQTPVDARSPKFFGGFAFGEGHVPDGVWEHFPSAHFLLPEIELVGGAEEQALTLRRFFPGSSDAARGRHRLSDEVASVVAALSPATAGPGLRIPCVPRIRSETESGVWETMVKRALTEIDAGGLSKVVMAREVKASFEGTVDPVDVVMNLWRENPGSHVFFFEPTPGYFLVGSAPETVATVVEGVFRATAVAGSIARGDTREDQEVLAAELLDSEKDRREHQVCVEDMLARLSRLSGDVQAQPEPHVLTLSEIQHLETAITARLHQNETVISALRALHPTPAVCGFPRDRALKLLRTQEPFERGWYAGPVGWFDVRGNGVFVPALRSAVGLGREWRLFAGAGIVDGSDPSTEWSETHIKLQPVLKALSGACVERPSHRARLGGT